MSIRKTFVAAALAAFAVVGIAGTASASGTDAVGAASNSPGLLSGDVIQVPVNLPLDLCGLDVSVLGALTGAEGNVCNNS